MPTDLATDLETNTDISLKEEGNKVQNDTIENKEANVEEIEREYLRLCSDLFVVPVSFIPKSLESTTWNLSHRGICDKSIKAMANCVAVSVTLSSLFSS
jgi:hypothetical protein